MSSQTSPGRKFPCSEEHCYRRKTLETVGYVTFINPGWCSRRNPYQKAMVLHGKWIAWDRDLGHRPGSVFGLHKQLSARLHNTQMRRPINHLCKVYWELPMERCHICWHKHQERCSSFYNFWFSRRCIHRRIFSKLLCIPWWVTFAQSHSVAMLPAAQQWLQCGLPCCTSSFLCLMA